MEVLNAFLFVDFVEGDQLKIFQETSRYESRISNDLGQLSIALGTPGIRKM